MKTRILALAATLLVQVSAFAENIVPLELRGPVPWAGEALLSAGQGSSPNILLGTFDLWGSYSSVTVSADADDVQLSGQLLATLQGAKRGIASPSTRRQRVGR